MKATPEKIDNLLAINQYKYLGWMNGWIKNNPKEYLSGNNLVYEACRNQKHKIDEVQHNNRGTEVTYSCDICKIYWKVDMGD
jgi:hypothetical protein